ncbi:hypothetical protein [Umezawaea sp. NPDC059074]|uniref:hypothetical protein n=1 Tax=Umezawaea sp. NPDC059074 TaxID=3346716 RepID=UPI0036873191
MSVEPGRVPAPDGNLGRLLWAQIIASKQTVSTYTVDFRSGETVELELTQAQAEGYECLTCKAECGTGTGAFLHAGWINDFSSAFRCAACVEGDV